MNWREQEIICTGWVKQKLKKVDFGLAVGTGKMVFFTVIKKPTRTTSLIMSAL